VGREAGSERRCWSERSGESLKTEAVFREQISSLQGKVRALEGSVAELESGKRRALLSARRNPELEESILDHILQSLDGKQRQLEIYREEAAAAEERLSAFLKEEQLRLPERREQQDSIAQLARELLAKGEQTERALSELRALLREHREMCAAIESGCARLGFDGSCGVPTLADVLESLPESILSETQVWCSGFLGETDGRSPYVVIAERIALPETLAHAGAYAFGETVCLSDAEAREWAAGEKPPIIAAEEFQAVEAEAREKGVTPGIVILIRAQEREAARTPRASFAPAR
jgi:hypothetical protein